jgi:hypothetical protein
MLKNMFKTDIKSRFKTKFAERIRTDDLFQKCRNSVSNQI